MKQEKKLIAGILVGTALIISALLLFGMAGQKQPEATAGKQDSQKAVVEDAVATTSVGIDNFTFSPAVIRVKVGETVTWTNNDSVRHNVVADTESQVAPNGPLINRGETYSFKFNEAGTYTYHCRPHPHMRATVIVTE